MERCNLLVVYVHTRTIVVMFLPKIKKPVKSSKKPANEQVQRQFSKTSKKPVMYQCKV